MHGHVLCGWQHLSLPLRSGEERGDARRSRDARRQVVHLRQACVRGASVDVPAQLGLGEPRAIAVAPVIVARHDVVPGREGDREAAPRQDAHRHGGGRPVRPVGQADVQVGANALPSQGGQRGLRSR